MKATDTDRTDAARTGKTVTVKALYESLLATVRIVEMMPPDMVVDDPYDVLHEFRLQLVVLPPWADEYDTAKGTP